MKELKLSGELLLVFILLDLAALKASNVNPQHAKLYISCNSNS